MINLESLYQIYLEHPRVVTDSRKIEVNCLFVALKGPSFNGNEYAEEALAKGAAFAIIDEAQFNKGERYLLVEKGIETLQALARHHRLQLEIPVIAITGSNGKTTTKELVSQVMNSHYRTHFTKGNLNNHIGVPLTLLSMPLNAEVAIIEMGANHQKEIAFLCTIAQPTHGLITNIGKAHLEGFGSLEGVKKGKGELFDFLAQHNGLAFVNLDEAFLEDLSKQVRHRLMYLQKDKIDLEETNYETQLLQLEPFVRAVFLSETEEKVEVSSHLIGRYNFQNMMTAIVLGRYFKVPATKIKAAIEAYVPKNNRSQLIQRSTNSYLLDAYNANPTSMQNTLDYFSGLSTQFSVVILGDMLELGEYSEQEHQNILNTALTYDFDCIVLVGAAFGQLSADGVSHVYQFVKVGEVKEWLAQRVFENSHFLIKGSRGIQLEKILEE